MVKIFYKKDKKITKNCLRTIPFFAIMCYNIMTNIIYSAELYPKIRREKNAVGYRNCRKRRID